MYVCACVCVYLCKCVHCVCVCVCVCAEVMHVSIHYVLQKFSKGKKLSFCIKLITVLQLRSFYNVMMKIVCVYNIYIICYRPFSNYKPIIKWSGPF